MQTREVRFGHYFVLGSRLRSLLVLLLLALFLPACAGKKAIVEERPAEEVNKMIEKNALPPRARLIPNPKYFSEVSAAYGLAGITAAHTYAVDLKNDGHRDLVFLKKKILLLVFFILRLPTKNLSKIPRHIFRREKRPPFLFLKTSIRTVFLM